MADNATGLQQMLDKFASIAADPHATMREWKQKTNKKVVSCAGLDVPEPLIEAAGMIPMVLLEQNKPIVAANAHVQSHMCGYVRSMVEQALTDDLSYVDCLMIKDCCHEIRMIGDLIPYITDKVKKVQFMYFPPELERGLTQDFTRREMAKMRGIISEIAGSEFSDEDLKKAIAIYNENKSLMIKLYDIRRANPGILSGLDVSRIVQASMCMPKTEHSSLLKELLTLLEEKASSFEKSKDVPVIVSGSICEICKDYVLESIESTGGVIIDDDLYVGSRYFNTLYQTDLDPMEALAQAYFNPVSVCPTKYENRTLGDYQLKMLEDTGAAAVINIMVQNCEPHYYSYFLAHRQLTQQGKKDLDLFIDIENEQTGQVKTRLQSFFESITENMAV